jgi:hypothetical protein
MSSGPSWNLRAVVTFKRAPTKVPRACWLSLNRAFVKGFGLKTEQKLLEAIGQARKLKSEIHTHKALRLADEVVSYLRLAPGVKQVEIAGPLRRWRETTPDITIVAATSHPADVLDHFAGFPLLIRVMERCDKSCLAILNTGIRARLIVTRPTIPVEKAGQVTPGEFLRFTMNSMNEGGAPAREYRAVGQIPRGAIFVAGSALGDGDNQVSYSIDNGQQFSSNPMIDEKQPDGTIKKIVAPISMYTQVRFEWADPLAAGGKLVASYQVRIK